jgi:hypothetical protein
MAQNQTKLVNRVLLDMNVVGLGQTVPAEVFADINSRVDTIIAELNGRNVANIDPDNIDDALFEPLVEYLIAKAGPGYGRNAVDAITLSLIEDRMKDVVRSTPRIPLKTDRVLRQGVLPILRNFWNC